MDIAAPILNVILGIILLATGKKLYWLLVAVVGFVIGLALATRYIQADPPWLVYVIAFAAGILGAAFGIFVQRLSIAMMGFLVGGFGAGYVASLLNTAQPYNWMAFIIGGIIGLLLVASVFDWALYILSSWAGATLITRTVTGGIGMDETLGLIVFFTLFVLGMVLQAGLFKQKPQTLPQPQPAMQPVEALPEQSASKKKK